MAQTMIKQTNKQTNKQKQSKIFIQVWLVGLLNNRPGRCHMTPYQKQTREVASSPGHSQILSHSYGEKLQDKIWEVAWGQGYQRGPGVTLAVYKLERQWFTMSGRLIA